MIKIVNITQKYEKYGFLNLKITKKTPENQ